MLRLLFFWYNFFTLIRGRSVEEDEKNVIREDVLRELENVTKYVKDEGEMTEDIKSKDYPVLFQLEDIVENYKEYLIKPSRTAKL